MNRREFLGGTAALSFSVMRPDVVRGSAANSAVRLGLLGCGGRGTGVAAGFLQDTAAHISAIGDLFPDNLDRAKTQLDSAAAKAGKPAVSKTFSGPDSAAQMMASKDIDAVYIATPPYFHPEHLELAVNSGKHVYVEKPVGVDVAGCERVRALGTKAQGKLSLAVGFQLRHATPYVELHERVQKGAIGQPVCGLLYYYAGYIARPEWPGASPKQKRLRNWIHDRVLSGDIIVEQNIHLIDVTNWILNGHPVKASGSAGPAGSPDPGTCMSHYNVTFTYPNDVHVSMTSTQFIKAVWDVEMRYFGTRGNAQANYERPVRITGEQPWNFPGLGPAGEIKDTAAAASGQFKGALEDADPNKQRAFIESITSGKFLNQAAAGADSALSAILGRMAAYTGRVVTWDEMMRSNERWESGLDVKAL